MHFGRKSIAEKIKSTRRASEVGGGPSRKESQIEETSVIDILDDEKDVLVADNDIHNDKELLA